MDANSTTSRYSIPARRARRSDRLLLAGVAAALTATVAIAPVSPTANASDRQHGRHATDTYVSAWDEVGTQAFTAAALTPAEGHVIFGYAGIAVYDAVMAVRHKYAPLRHPHQRGPRCVCRGRCGRGRPPDLRALPPGAGATDSAGAGERCSARASPGRGRRRRSSAWRVTAGTGHPLLVVRTAGSGAAADTARPARRARLRRVRERDPKVSSTSGGSPRNLPIGTPPFSSGGDRNGRRAERVTDHPQAAPGGREGLPTGHPQQRRARPRIDGQLWSHRYDDGGDRSSVAEARRHMHDRPA